jgi:DNA-binding transcriptional regulator YdaS (Cro superfamily)
MNIGKQKFKNSADNYSIDALNGVVKFFRSQTELANKLQLSRQCVNDWCKGKTEIPPLYAMKIEYITDGKFKAPSLLGEDKRCYLLNTMTTHGCHKVS